MTDREINQLLEADGAGCGLSYDDAPVIPAPRSGRSYELFLAETEGRHGCLDAPHA